MKQVSARREAPPFRAELFAKDESCVFSCIVTELGQQGATLLVLEDGCPPAECVLVLKTHSLPAHCCTLLWRVGPKIVVRFTSVFDMDKYIRSKTAMPAKRKSKKKRRMGADSY